MKHKKLYFAGLLALVGVAACGTSSEGQLPTPEMISEALPTITEMPGDWDETQRQVFLVREPENPSIDPSIWCSGAEEVTKNLIQLAGSTGADVEMQVTTSSKMARLMRLQAWSNESVTEYYRDAKEAVRICDGTSSTDSDGVVSVTEVISARDIGDESISWLQSTTPPPSLQQEKFTSMNSRTTIARFGDIMMILQLSDVSMSEATALLTDEQWWAIVELAGRKLDKLAEQVRD